jgi:poly(3-hydroxybutyrate) depolymerase
MKRWLDRLRVFLRRLFRREVAPGRYETGSKGSWRGFLASAPFVLPSREYLVYVPRGHTRWRRAPVLVLCHGCRQTPEELAAGTRIADVADRNGWLVLFPRQKEAANPWRCWSWFDTRTARGTGETAIVLAQLDAIRREYRADRRRVVVAGMSAGGALAAAVALRHADAVHGVFVHSGLACGAASAPIAALGVMKHGPDADVETIARDARQGAAAMPRLPLCVVHGDGVGVVALVNAVALVRQFLRFHAHPALDQEAGGDRTRLPPADREMRESPAPGRTVVTREWRSPQDELVARYVEVGGLGHAWSGGDAAYAFNDPAPPPATEALERFARDVMAMSRPHA